MADSIFPPLPEWFWYPVVFLYGSIVGSFLNVLIYRLPLKWADPHVTIGGKSYCPRCNTHLKPYHNVPLLAFLYLRGRCAFCKVRISWRYPMVELLTACVWTALYHQVSGHTGVSWINFAFQAVFAAILIAMVYIDLDHFIAPDELNLVGFLLGLGRDLACLALAWQGGRYLFNELAPQFAYFNWLPRAIPGAVIYGGAMLAVSYLGFLYYARREGESVASVSRRFLKDEEEQPEADVVLTEPAPDEAVAGTPGAPDGAIGDVEEEAGDPPRLQFSPGFVAVASALLLAIPAGAWAALAFVVPLLAFFVLSTKPGESAGEKLRRFFSADDQAGVPDDADPLPGNTAPASSGPSLEEQMKADADQFARDAESGAYGGMGLGDVKLALAVGAMLGPGMALLSLLFATGIGALTGGAMAAMSKRSLRLSVPFVPFMAAGALLVMLFGGPFVHWYLRISGIEKEPEPPRYVRPQRRVLPISRDPIP